jgi:hypothetical protein
MNFVVIFAILLFVVILYIAVIKIRRANPEQSATEMHPDNFQKPKIERVEKEKNSQKK